MTSNEFFEIHWDVTDKESAKEWYMFGWNDAKERMEKLEVEAAHNKQLAKQYKKSRNYWDAKNREVRDKIKALIEEATPS